MTNEREPSNTPTLLGAAGCGSLLFALAAPIAAMPEIGVRAFWFFPGFVAIGALFGVWSFFARGADRRRLERVRVRAAAEEAARAAAARETWEAQQQAEHARRVERERAYQADLLIRFGADVTGAIIRRELFVGAPELAVYEMFGRPDDVDERVLKTKTKRVLKYRDEAHAGRWRLRVMVEQGVVVGWER